MKISNIIFNQLTVVYGYNTKTINTDGCLMK